MECRVFRSVDCGSHELIVGEVVEVHADLSCVTDGKLDTAKVDPIIYAQYTSFSVGKQVARAFFAGKEYGT